MSALPQNIFTITSCKNVGTKHDVVPCWQSEENYNNDFTLTSQYVQLIDEMRDKTTIQQSNGFTVKMKYHSYVV